MESDLGIALWPSTATTGSRHYSASNAFCSLATDDVMP